MKSQNLVADLLLSTAVVPTVKSGSSRDSNMYGPQNLWQTSILVGAEQGVAVEEVDLTQKAAGWEVRQGERDDGSGAADLLACLVLDVLVLCLDQVLGQWYTNAGVADAEIWAVAVDRLAEG
jgi:hypothetical protein